MRNALLITLVLILALGAGAWYITSLPGKKDLTPWQLVPPTTLAVLETEQPRLLQKLNADSSGLVNALLSTDTTNAAAEPWLFCIQSLGKKTGIVALLKKTTASSPIELLKKASAQVTLKERSFESITINDVAKDGRPWLSVAMIRGVWLVSQHSLLIEEIIRHYRSENEQSFRKKHDRIFQLSNVKQDDGNLYINWAAFRAVTSKDQTLDAPIKAEALTDAMLFDLRFSGDKLLLNGFAIDSLTNRSLLSIFRSQKPVPFSLKNVLPDQFDYFIHFGISNPAIWLADRNDHTSRFNKDISGKLFNLETKTSFNTSKFFEAIDNEVAMCALPSGEHLIIAELKEITKGVSELSKINTFYAKSDQYTHERYANEDLHVLKQTDVSHALFWPMAFEAKELYYTVSGNLLILSDGEEGLKKFIDTMNGESTLNKSLEWNKFLESTLQESNVSFFASSGIGELFGSLRQPQKFSLQFYALEGAYYASAIMQFAKGSVKAGPVKNTRKGSEFNQKIAGAPAVVRNHTDRSNEVLITDASNQLYLLSKEQKVLWNLQLPGPVQGPIHQIDLLKNGKLQYLFVTAGKLHVVDRLGRYVTGYPKAVDISDAIYSSLIDYDNSKNYRLLLANDAGKIIVSDMDGKLLEGWNPKNLGRGFADAPTHFRIRQRDFYAAMSPHGDLFLFNRRGEISDGFPATLGFNPSGELVSDGKGLFAVSAIGTLVQINTQGKKVSEEALMKKAANSTFRLVASTDGDRFVVVRLEQGTIAAFDKSAKQLFEVPNPASENIELALYHFSDDRNVLIVFDKDQNLFYAVDLNGKLLIPQPLQASSMPSAAYQSGSKSLTFYVPDQNRLVNVSATF